jgi:hypothetical protein
MEIHHFLSWRGATSIARDNGVNPNVTPAIPFDADLIAHGSFTFGHGSRGRQA